jgi:hypothetical protein
VRFWASAARACPGQLLQAKPGPTRRGPLAPPGPLGKGQWPYVPCAILLSAKERRSALPAHVRCWTTGAGGGPIIQWMTELTRLRVGAGWAPASQSAPARGPRPASAQASRMPEASPRRRPAGECDGHLPAAMATTQVRPSSYNSSFSLSSSLGLQSFVEPQISRAVLLKSCPARLSAA